MLQTDQPLSTLVTEVSRLIRRRYESLLDAAGLGVTSGEARTLRHVSRAPGVSQAALAERMGIEPMTLVGFLDRLEARGLVRRVPSPTDRRAKLVELMPAAQPILVRVDGVLNGMRQEVTAQMDARSLEATARTLEQMRTALTKALQTARAP